MSNFERNQEEIPPMIDDNTYIIKDNELTTIGEKKRAIEMATTLDSDKIKAEEEQRNKDIQKAMEQLKRAA